MKIKQLVYIKLKVKQLELYQNLSNQFESQPKLIKKTWNIMKFFKIFKVEDFARLTNDNHMPLSKNIKSVWLGIYYSENFGYRYISYLYLCVIPKTLQIFLLQPCKTTDIKGKRWGNALASNRRSSYLVQLLSMTKRVQFNELIVNYRVID